MSEVRITEPKGTQSKPLRFLANVVSFALHPVFMPTVLVLLLYVLAPANFAGVDAKHFGRFLGIVVINTLIFPLITVLLLKALGFLQSIYMYDPKDRIIPLIATMIFYFWAYNVFKNIESPFILRVMLLGNFWGIILMFLINIFFKVSMHTSAAGGFLGVVLVLLIINPVDMTLPLFVSLITCGVIGTARLLLGAHKPFEIWAGFILGILVQVAAYIYLI